MKKLELSCLRMDGRTCHLLVSHFTLNNRISDLFQANYSIRVYKPNMKRSYHLNSYLSHLVFMCKGKRIWIQGENTRIGNQRKIPLKEY
jgi:hypothetical protein